MAVAPVVLGYESLELTATDIDAGTNTAQEFTATNTDAGTQISTEPILGSYRADIDGLRAVAVLAVMIYHLQESLLPGGFTGVDVFFVISGYVVTGSLLRAPHETALGYLGDFYARRMKRLSPALVLNVVVTALCLALFTSPENSSLKEYYTSGMFGLLGSANMYYTMISKKSMRNVVENGVGSGGYFDQLVTENGECYRKVNYMHDNPFLHLWSLGVEEQFYLLFPVLLIFVYGQRVAHSVCHIREAPQGYVHTRAWLALMCFVISLAVSWTLTSYEPDYAFFLMPSRFWQLVLGALLLHLQTFSVPVTFKKFVSHPAVLIVLDFATLLLLSLSFMVRRGGINGFPVPWAFVPVLGTIAFIAAGSVPERTLSISRCFSLTLPLCNKCLSYMVVVYIGRISYPLYLCHWPVLLAVKSNLPMHYWGLTMISASGAAAMLTYHFVEGFCRRWHQRHNRHVFIITSLLIGIALSWLALLQGPLYGALFLDLDCRNKNDIVRQAAQLQDEMPNALVGKHVVMVGDSITRYQYLNLAYHVLHRSPPSFEFFESSAWSRGFDAALRTPPYEQGHCWQQWYNATNWMLEHNSSNWALRSNVASEVCDCFRSDSSLDNVTENRFFSMRLPRVHLTYLQWFGDAFPFRGHGGLRNESTIDPACAPGACGPPWNWSMAQEGPNASVEQFVKDVVMNLKPFPTHVVMNRAKWGHLPPAKLESLFAVGKAMRQQFGTIFVWKTATRSREDTHGGEQRSTNNETAFALQYGWRVFDAYSATMSLGTCFYQDPLHFKEVGSTYLNLLMLHQLRS